MIRSWLRGASKRSTIPGASKVKERFVRFSTVLPTYCDDLGLDRDDLQFSEYVTLIEEWLKLA